MGELIRPGKIRKQCQCSLSRPNIGFIDRLAKNNFSTAITGMEEEAYSFARSFMGQGVIMIFLMIEFPHGTSLPGSHWEQTPLAPCLPSADRIPKPFILSTKQCAVENRCEDRAKVPPAHMLSLEDYRQWGVWYSLYVIF